MGLHSQEGHVGFKRQSGGQGVYDNPGVGGVFFRTKSGAMGGDRSLLIPDPEIGGNRDLPDAFLGPIAFKGTYEWYARMDMLATLMACALGDTGIISTPLGGGAHSHEITPIDSGSLPWTSVEEQVGDVFEVWNYTDAKVNTIHLEAAADGYLMGNAACLALGQVASPSSTVTGDIARAALTDTTPLIVGSNIVATWDGSQLPAKSFSFDVTNNIEDNDFRLGSLFLGDATEKRREFTAGVTIRPEDSDLWKQAMYGSAAATRAGGVVVKSGFSLLCQTYAVIAATAFFYSVQLDFDTAALVPFQINPSGDDVLEESITIQVLRPDPGTPPMVCTIQNDLAAVA